jgi:wyosine [tRNA(Phe)-imidazoG37] synthetase (radical SAM superfamily)
MRYVFGPVPSRRLGRSLGIDVVPFKTCTYDCIYCQLGRTTCKTVERKEWVPLKDVLCEVESRLSSRPDYITLSGSGEPTLFSGLGALVDRIKGMTGVPLALLTNGSLLGQPGVRREIQDVDLLMPSLDAGDEMTFRHINRPHDAISFDQVMEGLVASREACRGQYWLEVFLLAGYTDVEAEIQKLVRCVDRINPDRVQLNTVTRPPAERFAEGVSQERLAEVAAWFNAPTDVIAGHRHMWEQGLCSASRSDILNLLQRRPCSVEDIAAGLGMHQNEVVKYVEALQAEQLLETTWTSGKRYYRATGRNRRSDQQRTKRDGRRKPE